MRIRSVPALPQVGLARLLPVPSMDSTLTDGSAVSCRDFFGRYCRMLGRRVPACLPTPLALALAGGAAGAARVRGRETESNAATVRYLARRGGYSIEKARRVLGYRQPFTFEEGMARAMAEHRPSD